MRKSFFKNKFLLAGFLVVGVLMLVFVYVCSDTVVYKKSLSNVWRSGHAHGLVYFLNRKDADLAAAEGDYYFGGGAYDLARATAAYTQAMRLNPTISWAPYQLARIAFVEGDFEKALARINEERVLHPDNIRALYIRGLIDISRKDLPAAEADFKAFVASGQSTWGGYNDLSFVLAKEGKFEEAKKVVLEVMQKLPGAHTNPWLLNSLGITYLNLGEYTEAQSVFAQALPLAQKVTPEEWHRAYSGNDPASNIESIQTFIHAVEHNLLVAQSHNK